MSAPRLVPEMSPMPKGNLVTAVSLGSFLLGYTLVWAHKAGSAGWLIPPPPCKTGIAGVTGRTHKKLWIKQLSLVQAYLRYLR